MSLRRRFLVDPLPEAPTELPEQAAHHLLHVLRLGAGARITVFDGRGSERPVEVHRVEDDRVFVQPCGPITQARASRDAHLLLALLKPKALDVALRMAVEIGVTHVHVFRAERSVKRPPRLDRWERLIAPAAQQCGRADLPTVRAYPSLDAALDALPDGIPLFAALVVVTVFPAVSTWLPGLIMK